MTAMSQNLRLAENIFMLADRTRYVFTRGRKKICRDCCGVERRRFALDSEWIIVNDPFNKSGVKFRCDHCGSFIESRIC